MFQAFWVYISAPGHLGERCERANEMELICIDSLFSVLFIAKLYNSIKNALKILKFMKFSS